MVDEGHVSQAVSILLADLVGDFIGLWPYVTCVHLFLHRCPCSLASIGRVCTVPICFAADCEAIWEGKWTNRSLCTAVVSSILHVQCPYVGMMASIWLQCLEGGH